MNEPHEFWILCAKAKREQNFELDMLIQALAELCSHHQYSHLPPEDVYDAVKAHYLQMKGDKT